MSSVRGTSSRGRGRGSTQPPSSRGRGSSNARGRVFNSSAPRGNAIARGSFGQASRSRTGRLPQQPGRAPPNGASGASSQPGAFGVARTRGSWQDRYQTLLKTREQERTNAIRHGLIADPERPRALSEAITPVGTCQDMCAEYERVQRVVQKDVWDEETDPNHSAFATTDKEPDESRMVKKFRRAAAGLEEQLPSDLRPPQVLKRTCDYLFDDIIGNAPSLAQVHHFVWDRTRAVRNDFSIQQVTKPDELRIAIECYERIARFHILSLHQLALPEKPYSKYDWQQEREQLDRTLLSLMQYYDDSRGRINLPNEAEFRAYCVIFQLQDPTPDLEDRVQTWPRNIIQDTRVQKAFEMYMAACNVMDPQGPLKPRANHLIARQDWHRFWTLVGSQEVSYLMACVAEIYFNLVRRTVMNALFRTFRANMSLATPDWTIDVLCDLLAFDDGDEVYAYCERYGFSFKERDDGEHYLDLASIRGWTLPEPSAGIPKQSKTSLVENKRFGRTLPAVIDGFTVKRAEAAGLVNEEDGDRGMEEVLGDNKSNMDPHSDVQDGRNVSIDDNQSLFIPEQKPTTGAEPPEPSAVTNGLDTTERPDTIFGGLTGTSSFGKPSNFNEQPSPFAPAQTQSNGVFTGSAPKTEAGPFNFLSNPPSTAPSTTVQAPPKFDFLGSTGPLNTNQEASASKPETEPRSIFAPATAPFPSQAPPFSFTPPTSSATTRPDAEQQKTVTPVAAFDFAPKKEPKSSSGELWNGSSTFGAKQGDQATATPSFPSPNPETTVSQPQPHFTTSPTTSTSPPSHQHPSPSALNFGVRRGSNTADTKPRKPSPLSNSLSANDDSGSTAVSEPFDTVKKPLVPTESTQSKIAYPSVASSLLPPQATRQQEEDKHEDLDAIITRVAEEIVEDPVHGFLKQYIEYAVDRVIKDIQKQVITEQLNAEADDWREFALSRKYGRLWKQLFRRNRLAKSGRERREKRRRRLQDRSSRGEETSVVDTASIQSSSRAGSVLDVRSVGVNDEESNMGLQFSKSSAPSHDTAPVVQERQATAGSKRPMSSHGADVAWPSRESGHKRLKSTSHVDEQGRIAKPTFTGQPNADILKRSSFLGFSVAKDAPGINKNATVSNYFRLKAMGVHRADESSGLRSVKRQRSGSLQSMSQTSPPSLRSSVLRSTVEQSNDRSLMPPPSRTPSQAVKANEDDDALLARIKAARESLKESTSYLQTEMSRTNGSRGSADSQSGGESPSMAQARIDARIQASRQAQNASNASIDRSVPAYRLRESRFVPREQYGRAIERAKEIRQSRSRETSRPQSTTGDDRADNRFDPPVRATEKQRDIEERNPQSGNHLAEISPNTPGPNGFAHSPGIQIQDSTFMPNEQALSFASPGHINFANHTTELSSQNPFLQASLPNSFDTFSTQPMFDFKSKHPPVSQPQDQGPFTNSANMFGTQQVSGVTGKQSPFSAPQDQTIQPSQINQSLRDSFGAPYPIGKDSYQPWSQEAPTPPQANSYLPSQAISLLSDDEDEDPTQTANHVQFQSPSETEEATEELLDESTEEDHIRNTYGHQNPYAALARDNEENESQGWDSQVEYDQHDEEQQDGYDIEDGDVNGYADDEDDEDVDEDVEDELDEEEGMGGYEDEDEEGYEDEEESYQYEEPASPEKNPALQSFGNTAEEAIELSD